MANKTFLDKTGLTYFWGKIKAKIPTKTSDLTNDSNYVKTTDYASNNTGGVIKTGNSLSVSNGSVYADTLSYNDYQIVGNERFVGKGTLENVLTGKNYQDALVSGTNIKTINNEGLLGSGNITIIESGSNTNGNYIKYIDGTMICYKTITSNVAMTTAWDSYGWYEGNQSLGNYAQEFIDVPNVFLTNISTSGALVECFSTAPSKTSAGVATYCRVGSTTRSIKTNLIAIGRWKA